MTVVAEAMTVATQADLLLGFEHQMTELEETLREFAGDVSFARRGYLLSAATMAELARKALSQALRVRV